MNRYSFTALGLVYFIGPFFFFRRFVSADVYRLQSVCSLIASLCLSGTAVREAWAGDTVSGSLQKRCTEFYVVYAVVDMVLGTFYYPRNMKRVDGYFHHFLSGAFGVYCLYTDRCFLMSQALVVEASTIFLALPRVFPSVFNNHLVKKYVFPVTFLVCRLMLLPYVVFQNRHRLYVGETCFALGFTFINIRWFLESLSKQWKN